MDFSQRFEKIKDSVVNVRVVNGDRISLGSGVLIGDGTQVLTCSHCVIPGLSNTIKFSEKNEVYEGQIIFNDPKKDIAVIEFKQSMGPGVTLRDSSTVKIGQEAFVVGFPNNIDKITALSANIAGFEPLSDGYDWIRIDSSINNGNSGGPLFNANGELIGIVNAKHGSLSQLIDRVKNAPSGAFMVGSLDPITTLKDFIFEMQKNLNLGIGYAIPTNVIGNSVSYVKKLIV
jgi:serine protease Do